MDVEKSNRAPAATRATLRAALSMLSQAILAVAIFLGAVVIVEIARPPHEVHEFMRAFFGCSAAAFVIHGIIRWLNYRDGPHDRYYGADCTDDTDTDRLSFSSVSSV
jgi:hypothetical protein